MVDHQAEKAAILDKCCQSVECLARGKVFDLVGTLDLPQSSSPVTETAFAPGWLSRTLYASHIAVMANYHAGIGPGRAKTPVPDNEAADLFKILDERFKSWTGKSLEDWCAGHAQTGQQRIAAPGNDQLSKLWNAIVENTKGDGFWIGEILLTTLEREVGFNPIALTDTSTAGNSK